LTLRNRGARSGSEGRHEHCAQPTNQILRAGACVLPKTRSPRDSRVGIAELMTRYCLQQGLVGCQASARLIIHRLRDVIEQGLPNPQALFGGRTKETSCDRIDDIEPSFDVDPQTQAIPTRIAQQSLGELADVWFGHGLDISTSRSRPPYGGRGRGAVARCTPG
jgi:hypothetical protein